MLQFDLYTCGDLDPHLVYKEVQNFFGLGSYTMRVYDRANGDMDRVSIGSEIL